MLEVALRIKYHILCKSETEQLGLEDLKTFRQELQRNYITTLETKVAERGGGNVIIEVLLNLKLENFIEMIAGGIAWDHIKYGGKSYFLSPFIEAYRKFRLTPYSQEIRDIDFVFEDTRIHISSITDGQPEVSFANIARIFQAISLHYSVIQGESYNHLANLFVPIFHDLTIDEELVYREKLPYDEPLESLQGRNVFDDAAYLNIWGLEYFDYSRKIYDVSSKSIVDRKWYTEEEFHWYSESRKK